MSSSGAPPVVCRYIREGRRGGGEEGRRGGGEKGRRGEGEGGGFTCIVDNSSAVVHLVYACVGAYYWWGKGGVCLCVSRLH